MKNIKTKNKLTKEERIFINLGKIFVFLMLQTGGTAMFVLAFLSGTTY